MPLATTESFKLRTITEQRRSQSISVASAFRTSNTINDCSNPLVILLAQDNIHSFRILNQILDMFRPRKWNEIYLIISTTFNITLSKIHLPFPCAKIQVITNWPTLTPFYFATSTNSLTNLKFPLKFSLLNLGNIVFLASLLGRLSLDLIMPVKKPFPSGAYAIIAIPHSLATAKTLIYGSSISSVKGENPISTAVIGCTLLALLSDWAEYSERPR